jgi:PAS domain S-box-containing protein
MQQISTATDKEHLEKEILKLRSQVAVLKAKTEAMQDNEVCYHTLFQSHTDAVFVMSGDKFLDCNQATEEIFRCSRKDIVGSHPYIFSPPTQPDGRDSKEKAIEKITSALSSQVQSFEWVHTRFDGTPFYADVSLNCLKMQGEHRLLAVVRDTSERKRTEQELQSYLQELSTLHAIAVAGAHAKSVDGLLQVSTQILNNKVYTDSLAIGLVDYENRLVRFFTPRQPFLEYPYRQTIPLSTGIAGEVIRTGIPIRIPDVRRDARYIGGNPHIRSELCIPLTTKEGKTIGVINAESNQVNGFSTSDEQFLTTVARQLITEIEKEQLFTDLHLFNIELEQAYDTTLLGWAKALELRDKETAGHSQRVTELAIKLARELGIHEGDLVNIYRGSILHDIGKMGIPDSILHKEGPLTEEERAVIRMHPVIARDLLENIQYLQPALDIPYLHHEKWDGSGYPLGLKGEEIPLAARIFAIVDVWDSLLSDRCYRPAWSEEEVRKYIREQSGQYFDPKIVEVFLRVV